VQASLLKMRKAKDKKKGSNKNKAPTSDRPMSGVTPQQTSGLS
jgi:hypothetical protein